MYLHIYINVYIYNKKNMWPARRMNHHARVLKGVIGFRSVCGDAYSLFKKVSLQGRLAFSFRGSVPIRSKVVYQFGSFQVRLE